MTPSLCGALTKIFPCSVVFLSTAAPSCPRSLLPPAALGHDALTAFGCLYKLSLTEFNFERKIKTFKRTSLFLAPPVGLETNDTAVNSRVLYRLSYGGILKPTKQSLIGYLCRHRPIFPGRFQEVFSARMSLTTVFGMGTGGPSS